MQSPKQLKIISQYDETVVPLQAQCYHEKQIKLFIKKPLHCLVHFQN